ncbi:peptidase family M48-domain-containing protein [Lactarius hatsudake]|nr:peptidase family M48-domain-containing protein [Lactarius hatsudake]
MFAIRKALPFLSASSSRYRPTPSALIRHLESRVQTRLPPRRTVPLSPHRNISISAARRAQYSRFDDHPSHQDPNRPPPSFSGFQRRDVIIYTLGVGSVVYYLLHLEQVPETGRWRFMDVSPKFEAALWEASYDELSQQYRAKLLPPSHVVTQHVHRVVSRILEANNLGTLRGDQRVPTPPRSMLQPVFGAGNGESEEGVPDLWDPDSTGHGAAQGSGKQWNLLVVNDKKVVNAMAAPGTVVVFTGILPVAKDEQGLAAILGHEIGHVVARHSAERYSYSKIFIAMAWLADIIGLPSGVGGLATTLLMDLPHSRKQEYEADKIGLKLSAKACFNPTAAPEMFKRLGALEKSGGGMNVSFLNTHPASEERVRQLEALLPEAFSVQASACGGVSDYMGAFGEAIGLERRARVPWE